MPQTAYDSPCEVSPASLETLWKVVNDSRTLVLPCMWLGPAEGSTVLLLSTGLLGRWLPRSQKCIFAEACDQRLRLYLQQRLAITVRLDAKQIRTLHFQPLSIEMHGIGCIATVLVCPTP